MGASEDYRTVYAPDGGIVAAVNGIISDDQYENGHSYSGSIGMATGVSVTDKTFDSESDAVSYLFGTAENAWEGACEKWGPAIAVRLPFMDEPDGILEAWLVGALCSS